MEQKDFQIEEPSIKDARRITAFLYELMRDHVPPGVVQKVFNNSPRKDFTYTNHDLARYAQKLGKELAPGVCKCGHPRSEHQRHCTVGGCQCSTYND